MSPHLAAFRGSFKNELIISQRQVVFIEISIAKSRPLQKSATCFAVANSYGQPPIQPIQSRIFDMPRSCWQTWYRLIGFFNLDTSTTTRATFRGYENGRPGCVSARSALAGLAGAKKVRFRKPSPAVSFPRAPRGDLLRGLSSDLLAQCCQPISSRCHLPRSPEFPPP